MADHAAGSSLPQIQRRGRQSHVHYHNQHNQHHHDNRHEHTHNHARSHHDTRHDRRDPDAASASVSAAESTVVIVQTISVYQVTDASGATIIQTLPKSDTTTSTSAAVIQTTDIQPSPAATTTASTTATTASSSSLLDDSTTSASSSDDDVDTASSAAYPTAVDPTVTTSGSSMPTSFPTLSYASFTSAPLTPTSVFPSFTGHSNSTQASVSTQGPSNSTASLHSFTSSSASESETDGAFTIFGSAGTSSTTTSLPSSSLTFTDSHVGTGTSTTHYSSPTLFTSSSSSSYDPDVTALTAGGDGLTTASTPTASVAVSDDSNGQDTTVSKATIAGSVVGAISGFVFLLLLATAFLRWKKRHPGIKLLGNERGAQGMLAGAPSGPAGGGGDTSGGDMAQRRRSIPFAIPAALAHLSGQSRFSRSTVSSDGGERGFAKISGRKLPPVLQFGGDGYTDPRRATMMSDQSIDYRDSQVFFGDVTSSRLAVGSPMLQETNTPVFHASPARTAIREEGPFNNPFSDDNAIGHDRPPPSSGDRSAFGRHRFTEDL